MTGDIIQHLPGKGGFTTILTTITINHYCYCYCYYYLLLATEVPEEQGQ